MSMKMTQFDKRNTNGLWLLLVLGVCLALSCAEAQTTTARTTTTTATTRRTTPTPTTATTRRTTTLSATTTTTTKRPAGTTAKQPEAKCQLPLDPGPCRMNLERYYFNAKTNTCETFKFGGCRGNDNKFGFRKTCEDACLRK